MISFVNFIFSIAYFGIFAHWALHWLTILEIVRPGNPAAKDLIAKGDKVLAPVYTRIRKVLPLISGIDFTPLAAIFGLWVVNYTLVSILAAII